MKKFLSLALCLALVLSLGVSAFAEVIVDGNAKGTGKVTVDGDAEYVKANASGDDLTVNGKVVENGDKDAVSASNAAEITVNGDVTESGNGNAVYAESGATVTIMGNVSESNGSLPINAAGGTVKVKGDVKQTDGDGESAIRVSSSGNVIVEGVVTGDVQLLPDSNSFLYLGQLDGEIKYGGENVFYLIGMSDGAAGLKEFNFSGVASAAEGASGKSYNTVCANGIAGSQITITPKTDKVLDTAKLVLPAGVEKVEQDGALILKFADGFKGGLQNMVLILADKPVPGPDPGPDPDPDPTPVSVIYVVPVNSYTVVELVLPEGVAEDLITKLDSADHAGITVDSSLVGDGAVKVLKGDQELSEDDFSVYTHSDGSIDVILRNTYLYNLGTGSYDFTAIINGMEIPFTVAVAI